MRPHHHCADEGPIMADHRWLVDDHQRSRNEQQRVIGTGSQVNQTKHPLPMLSREQFEKNEALMVDVERSEPAQLKNSHLFHLGGAHSPTQ